MSTIPENQKPSDVAIEYSDSIDKPRRNNYVNDEDYDQAVSEYETSIEQIELQFESQLSEYFKIENKEIHDKIYMIAKTNSEDDTYTEIEKKYSEYSQLSHKLIK